MPRELSFNINGLHLAAQEWGGPGQRPVLALHGWLDNSASFTRLAEHLGDVHLVALDLAGHGQSDHRLGTGPYNIWEDVPEVFAVADQLGWMNFSLLGHSRGAIIAMLAAGTFPLRIDRLGLIDGLWPEPIADADAPEQLARSIRELERQRDRRLSVYANIDEAVTARQCGRFPLAPEAARLMVERGVRAVPGGYSWSSDSRLLAASAMKLTQGQVRAFVERIDSPVKLVLARDGVKKLYGQYLQELALFPQIDVEVLAGGHHLHMEQQVAQVGAILREFFAPAKTE